MTWQVFDPLAESLADAQPDMVPEVMRSSKRMLGEEEDEEDDDGEEKEGVAGEAMAVDDEELKAMREEAVRQFSQYAIVDDEGLQKVRRHRRYPLTDRRSPRASRARVFQSR